MDAWDGARFRDIREENGQSQGDVAHALGVWSNTVSRWELGVAVPCRKYQRKLEGLYPALLIPPQRAAA
jgi:transcriptional regulator with XRE-family HTH domain